MQNPASRIAVPSAERVTGAAALHLRRLLRGQPRLRLDSHETYSSRLHIEGAFRPGWVGSLAAGVAEHGISIAHGHAESDPLGSWTADFLLERTPTGTIPSLLDFMSLADRHVNEHAEQRIELAIGSASRVSDHGGSLLVVVEGRDQIGFLATVLTRLAKVRLYPVEIAVTTTAGVVADRLWLRPAGHRPPDVDALRAVSLALHPVAAQDC